MLEARIARPRHQLSLLYFALVAALVAGAAAATAVGLPVGRLLVALLALIPAAFVGARLWYALAHPDSSARSPHALLDPRRGGLSLVGALPAALLASLPLTRALGLPFAAFWDVATLALLVALVPFKLRCFAGGCCAGRVSRHRLAPHARDLSGRRERRVPVQLFEALLCALVALLLAALSGALQAGASTLIAAGLYGAGRFVLEAYRAESSPVWRGVRGAQWQALALVAVAATLLAATGLSRGEALSPDAALQVQAAALALLPAALVALPIALVLRFVACGLLLDLDPPDEEPEPPPPDEPVEVYVVTTIVAVAPTVEPGPDVTFECRVPVIRDTGPLTIQMEPTSLYATGEELARGTIDLAFVSSDGVNEIYRAVASLPMTDYRVTCRVFDTGVEALSDDCTGNLSGPGLTVGFRVTPGMAVLQDVLCFA